MTKTTGTSEISLFPHEDGYAPIEDRLRQNIRSTIEAVFEEELEGILGRCRYGRTNAGRKGYRNGHRVRGLKTKMGRSRNGARRRCPAISA